MDLELNGKRVLITGASKGLGLAMATRFAQEGCNLELVARTRDQLQAVANTLHEQFGVQITTHALDLATPGAPSALADSIGTVDILVNNAGAIPFGTLSQIDEEQWRAAWDLKVFGYISLSRAMYARMAQRQSGVIVLIAGLAGERVSSNYVAGSAGNAALMAFGRALGGTSLKDGIRVLAVNPGPILTERLESMCRLRAHEELGDESAWPQIIARMNLPAGRAGSPAEIADVVAFLSSSRASYISGTVVTVDGGLASANSN